MAMKFDNEVQEKVHGNITKWGRELYGEMLYLDDDGDFAMGFGSAVIWIRVQPFGDDECIINIYSLVIVEVELTPDLMKFLLQTNRELPFGLFAVNPDSGSILLDENLVGSSCTKEELRLTVGWMGKMVDRFDDEIKSKWGGLRAEDR